MNPHGSLHMPKHADYVNTCDRKCPVCAASLIRTPRRHVDRVWSIFEPVLRFRCQRFSCQWQGNLPRDIGTGDDAAHSSGSGRGVRRRPRRIPRQFKVQMVLAVGGAVLVFVAAYTEPTALRAALDFGSSDPGWVATSGRQAVPDTQVMSRTTADASLP